MGTIRRHSAQGLSLIEVLVTLSVLSLAVGMIATLANQYLRLTTPGNDRTKTTRQVEVLQLVLKESLGATRVARPEAPGQSLEEIVFLKVDPNPPDLPALPAGAPAPPPPPDRQIQVRYCLREGQLWREASTGGDPVSLVVASDVRGFAVTRVSAHELEFALTYAEADEPKTLRSRLYLWAPGS